jgi:urease accessory protein
MNQFSRKARFGGDLRRSRPTNFRDSTRQPRIKHGAGRGCAACMSFSRAHSTLGIGGILIAVYSERIIVIWKRAEFSLQDEAKSWWMPMTDNLSALNLTDDLNSPDLPETRAGNLSDKDLQRAEGSCRIVVGGSERGTRVIDVFQKSPIRVLFPRVGAGATEEAVLINTAGGIAGGDQLNYGVTALDGAFMAITSQAAEKVYGALDASARITTKLRAFAGAKLAWLPQETITFNRARLRRETEIEITFGAELLALEWLVLGRAAHGEKMVSGNISESWRVKKDGRLVWADAFRLTDKAFPRLHSKALLAECKAIGTLIYFGPDCETRLELLREIGSSAECQFAATSVGGLIIIRLAAKASFDLRSALRSFLERFGRAIGPGPFRVPRMWSC